MATIRIRNSSSADRTDIFVDKEEIEVASGQEVEHTVPSGTRALFWMARGKKDQTVKIVVRNSAGVAARVNRTLKSAGKIADGRTFVA